MSVGPAASLLDPDAIGHEELRRFWNWLLILGIILVVLGVIALGCIPWVTEAFVIYYGLVLIFSGIVGGVQATRFRRGAAFFLGLLSAVLDVVVGFLMLTYTWDAAAIMTLLLAAFFLVTGLFRIFTSLSWRFPNWGWSLLAGVVSVMLWVAIWRRWPLSTYWAVGLFVGLELLFRGWALIMLSLAARRLSAKLGQPAA
jgi:uncharacterized membrane protein HdeD (DUF308 family)